MRFIMQYSQTASKVLAMLVPFIFVFLLTGCSVSYQGERVQLSPEMIQEINSVSTDEAIETLKDYYEKQMETYDSYITSDEWERMKEEMHSKRWIERQLTTGNLDESRKTWHEWVATTTAIEHRTYREDTSEWVETSRTPYAYGTTIVRERQQVPPETIIDEYRYTDVIELRTITSNNGKVGLILYCDVKTGSGFSFWTYPGNDKDIKSLTMAFIKLCPNIRN